MKRKLNVLAGAVALLLMLSPRAEAISINSGDVVQVVYNSSFEYVANLGQASDIIAAATSGGGMTIVTPIGGTGNDPSGIDPTSVFGSDLSGLNVLYMSWQPSSPNLTQFSLGGGTITEPTPTNRNSIIAALNQYRDLIEGDPDGNPIDINTANPGDALRSIQIKFGNSVGDLNGLLSYQIEGTTMSDLTLDFYELDFQVPGQAMFPDDPELLGAFTFNGTTGETSFSLPGAAVPEPATVLLLGSGLISLFYSRRRPKV